MGRDDGSLAFRCYVDTSALVKRYLDEAGTEAFDKFCERPGLDPLICPVGITEFSSVLEVRRRLGKIASRNIPQVWQRFLTDVAAGGWHLVAFSPTLFDAAATLTRELGAPLATLDACTSRARSTRACPTSPRPIGSSRPPRARRSCGSTSSRKPPCANRPPPSSTATTTRRRRSGSAPST